MAANSVFHLLTKAASQEKNLTGWNYCKFSLNTHVPLKILDVTVKRGSSSSGTDCGSRERRDFRWMWACVRPRHRATSVRLTGLDCRMTRLCCSCDKDKLQPLEDIFTFFPALSPPQLSPHLFFVGIGFLPNVSLTKEKRQRGIWERNISVWQYPSV